MLSPDGLPEIILALPSKVRLNRRVFSLSEVIRRERNRHSFRERCEIFTRGWRRYCPSCLRPGYGLCLSPRSQMLAVSHDERLTSSWVLFSRPGILRNRFQHEFAYF